MEEIGVFTPEQARLLWQDFQRRRQLQPQLQANFPQRRLIDEPSPHRVFLKNTTAETIPAFSCCEIVGTEDSGNITAMSVAQPSSIDGHFVFNGPYPIAAGETGWGYRHGIVLMLGDEPATVGEAYQPIVDSWEIEVAEGGPFTVFGRDRTSDRTLVGRFAGGGSGGGGGLILEWSTMLIDCPPGTGNWYVTPSAFSGGCGEIPGTVEDPYSEFYGLVEVSPPKCGTVNLPANIEEAGGGTAVWLYPVDDCSVGFWRAIDYCVEQECSD